MTDAMPSLGLDVSEPIALFRSHFGLICRRSVSLGLVIWTSPAGSGGHLTALVVL